MSDELIDMDDLIEGAVAKVNDEVIGVNACFANQGPNFDYANDPAYWKVNDGVMKCDDCGNPQYLDAPDSCNSPNNHMTIKIVPSTSQPFIPVGTGNPPIIVNTGIESQPTTIELAKALQKCFAKIGPNCAKPLEDLIKQHEGGFVPPSTEQTDLEKAMELLEQVRQAAQVEVAWDREAAKFLRKMGREVKDEDE